MASPKFRPWTEGWEEFLSPPNSPLRDQKSKEKKKRLTLFAPCGTTLTKPEKALGTRDWVSFELLTARGLERASDAESLASVELPFPRKNHKLHAVLPAKHGTGRSVFLRRPNSESLRILWLDSGGQNRSDVILDGTPPPAQQGRFACGSDLLDCSCRSSLCANLKVLGSFGFFSLRSSYERTARLTPSRSKSRATTPSHTTEIDQKMTHVHLLVL